MASLSTNGYNHSIPVPRIYKRASKIAKDVKEGKDSLKNLVFQEKHVSIKTVYALIVETFKRDEIISKLMEKSELLINHPRFDPWLAKILICELLWGKNKMKGASKPIQTILNLEGQLRKLLSTCNNSVKVLLKHDIVKPRYVRINTLKVTVPEAVSNFVEEGWILIPSTQTDDYKGFLQTLKNLQPDEFMIDFHIPNLLIFPPKTEFYHHEAYKSRSIILQDKASCLPVHLLSPMPGSTVLDMCAAPGMKTTQLAAMLKDSGHIYAVELSEKREKLLKEFVNSTGATCVKTILKDVMKVTKEDCPAVEYVLVDPSCSGSGITDRVEVENLDFTDRIQRLRKLSNFQSKLLRHALNAFPQAKRIVYSTCSINSEENEDVVRQVLETCKYFKLIDARKILKSWNKSASKIFPELGDMCVYATPEKDKTNGFFVAVFEPLADGEKNPFLNVELCKMYDKNTAFIKETTQVTAALNSQSIEINSSMQNKEKQRKFKTKFKRTTESGFEKNDEQKCVQIDTPTIESNIHSVLKKKKKRRDIETIIDISNEISHLQKNENVGELQESKVRSEVKLKKEKKQGRDEIGNSDATILLKNMISNDTDVQVSSVSKKKKNKVRLGTTEEPKLSMYKAIHNDEILDEDPSESKKNKKCGSEKMKCTEIENTQENFFGNGENDFVGKRTKNKHTNNADCEPSVEIDNQNKTDVTNVQKKRKNRESNIEAELLEAFNFSKIKKKKVDKTDCQPQYQSEKSDSKKIGAEIDNGKVNVEIDHSIVKETERSRKTKTNSAKLKILEDPLVYVENEHFDISRIEKNRKLKINNTETQEPTSSSGKKKKSCTFTQCDVKDLDRINNTADTNQSILNDNKGSKKAKKRKSKNFEQLEHTSFHENTCVLNISEHEKNCSKLLN